MDRERIIEGSEDCNHTGYRYVGAGMAEDGTEFVTKRCLECNAVWDEPQDWEIGSDDPEVTHKTVEETECVEQEWPQYYVSGESINSEEFVSAYFRVEGPNGPVSYMNPGSERPSPMTMMGLVMEAKSDDFRQVFDVSETPFNESS